MEGGGRVMQPAVTPEELRSLMGRREEVVRAEQPKRRYPGQTPPVFARGVSLQNAHSTQFPSPNLPRGVPDRRRGAGR